MNTQQKFEAVYNNFKLHFYREIFRKIQGRETSLTTVEAFCMEVIYALDGPTISEFGSFIGLSTPNTAYKIANLVKKGYLVKEQCKEDKREYRLRVTQRYLDCYNISSSYMNQVIGNVEKQMTPEEIRGFDRSLEVIFAEEMKETPLPGMKRTSIADEDEHPGNS